MSVEPQVSPAVAWRAGLEALADVGFAASAARCLEYADDLDGADRDIAAGRLVVVVLAMALDRKLTPGEAMDLWIAVRSLGESLAEAVPHTPEGAHQLACLAQFLDAADAAYPYVCLPVVDTAAMRRNVIAYFGRLPILETFNA